VFFVIVLMTSLALIFVVRALFSVGMEVDV
jgi:hypothetical protein